MKLCSFAALLVATTQVAALGLEVSTSVSLYDTSASLKVHIRRVLVLSWCSAYCRILKHIFKTLPSRNLYFWSHDVHLYR